jgi:UDP-2,3-diacylglucosamine pyrophosphatase LpxH
MKPILFLSDIHLGSNLFDLEEGLIELLKNNYEKIYILGDLIDTWECDIETIIEKYERIINFIRSKKRIEIICGNHDPEYEIMKKIFPNNKIYEKEHTVKLNGYKIALIHGDKYDSLLAPYLFFLNTILKHLYYFTDKKLQKNLKNYIRNFYYNAKYHHYTYNIISNIERHTVNHYRESNYDCLIMGHTHMPKIVNTPFFKYINSGSIIYKPCFVEYYNGNFILVRI